MEVDVYNANKYLKSGCMFASQALWRLQNLISKCIDVFRCKGLPPRFIQQSEPVRLKLATHKTDLRFGTDEWGGIWNWVRNARWAATTESLGMNVSTAIARAFDHAFSAIANGRGAEWGQLGKKIPPPLLLHYRRRSEFHQFLTARLWKSGGCFAAPCIIQLWMASLNSHWTIFIIWENCCKIYTFTALCTRLLIHGDGQN